MNLELSYNQIHPFFMQAFPHLFIHSPTHSPNITECLCMSQVPIIGAGYWQGTAFTLKEHVVEQDTDREMENYNPL